MNARIFWRERAAFQAFNQSKDLSPHSVILYDAAIRYFHTWFVEVYGEDARIGPRQVREFIAHRLAQGNKRSTIKAYVGALQVYCGFLVMDEIIAEEQNPMRLVKPPKAPKPNIRPLTNREIHDLLESFDKESPVGYRNYIICLLILDTGVRVGEAARLMLGDVNIESRNMEVKGKGQKRRGVYMGDKMAEILRAYIEHRRPEIANGHRVLFPPAGRSTRKAMNPKYLSDVIAKQMRAVGIPPTGSSAHRLRHSFAVRALRGGLGVFHLKALLGHATLDMTLRYVTLDDRDLAKAARRASPVDRLGVGGGGYG